MFFLNHHLDETVRCFANFSDKTHIKIVVKLKLSPKNLESKYAKMIIMKMKADVRTKVLGAMLLVV